MKAYDLYSSIEEKKDELFALLSELIKINSESFVNYGNEEECAKYVYEYCKKNRVRERYFFTDGYKGF